MSIETPEAQVEIPEKYYTILPPGSPERALIEKAIGYMDSEGANTVAKIKDDKLLLNRVPSSEWLDSLSPGEKIVFASIQGKLASRPSQRPPETATAPVEPKVYRLPTIGDKLGPEKINAMRAKISETPLTPYREKVITMLPGGLTAVPQPAEPEALPEQSATGAVATTPVESPQSGIGAEPDNTVEVAVVDASDKPSEVVVKQDGTQWGKATVEEPTVELPAVVPAGQPSVPVFGGNRVSTAPKVPKKVDSPHTPSSTPSRKRSRDLVGFALAGAMMAAGGAMVYSESCGKQGKNITASTATTAGPSNKTPAAIPSTASTVSDGHKTVASATSTAPTASASDSGSKLQATPTPASSSTLSAATNTRAPATAPASPSPAVQVFTSAHRQFDIADLTPEMINSVSDSGVSNELKKMLTEGKVTLAPGTSPLGQIFNNLHKTASTPEQRAYFYYLENLFFVGEHASKNPQNTTYAEKYKAALAFYEFINKSLKELERKGFKGHVGETVQLNESLQFLARLGTRPFLSNFAQTAIYGDFATWLMDHPQVMDSSPYGETWKYKDTHGYTGVQAGNDGAQVGSTQPVGLKADPIILSPDAMPSTYTPPEPLTGKPRIPGALDDNPWFKAYEEKHPEPPPLHHKKPKGTDNNEVPPEYRQGADGKGSLLTPAGANELEKMTSGAMAFLKAINEPLKPTKGVAVYTYIRRLWEEHFGPAPKELLALIKGMRASKGACFTDAWRENCEGKKVKRGWQRYFTLTPEFIEKFEQIVRGKGNDATRGIEEHEAFPLTMVRAEPFELITPKMEPFALATEATESFELVEEPIPLINRKTVVQETANAVNTAVAGVIEETAAAYVKTTKPDSFADADPFVEPDPFAGKAQPLPPGERISGVYDRAETVQSAQPVEKPPIKKDFWGRVKGRIRELFSGSKEEGLAA